MQKVRWRPLFWRRVGYMASLALFPIAFLCSVLAARLDWVFPVSAGIALICYFVSGEMLGRWPCPRCGLRFSHKKGTYRTIPLRNRCVLCGLAYGASEEEISAPYALTDDEREPGGNRIR
jgi:hypothetical protein